MIDLQVGDVVQIKPDSRETFGGCFMVVTEPKEWGAQGYVNVPDNVGLAYYRCSSENMARIGKAEWLNKSETDELERAHAQ